MAASPSFGQGAPGETPERTFSENRRFSAEIAESEINNPKLTVFQHEGGSAQVLWSRRLVDPNAPNPEAIHMELNLGHRKWVANDGSAVVLRPSASYGPEAKALRVLTRKNGDKTFTTQELASKVSAVGSREEPGFTGRGVVELFLEDKSPPIYARWHISGIGWMVLNLGTLQLAEATAAQTTDLEAKALAQSRELVRAR